MKNQSKIIKVKMRAKHESAKDGEIRWKKIAKKKNVSQYIRDLIDSHK